MSLPHRRGSRPRGRARLAPAADRDDTRWLSQISTDPADGTTWAPSPGPSAVIFSGASDIGLMPDGSAGDDGTQPIAMLRTQPPPFSRAGYDATTGPIPALGRPAITIGDALTRDDVFGPKLTPLPCGHCGTPPPVPGDILERTRIIGHVNWLAARAGWAFDTDMTWTCPDCQRSEAWKARQGQLELHRYGETCLRHDAGYPDEDCTCPGAVLAVDVMLASEDHLGSRRGGHRAVTR